MSEITARDTDGKPIRVGDMVERVRRADGRQAEAQPGWRGVVTSISEDTPEDGIEEGEFIRFDGNASGWFARAYRVVEVVTGVAPSGGPWTRALTGIATGAGLHRPGAKDDTEKLDYTLLEDFSRALRAVTQVAQEGAKKYSRGGWLEVPDGQRRYRAAARRHYAKRVQGEVVDPEFGFLHLAHEAWNVLAELERQLREEGTA